MAREWNRFNYKQFGCGETDEAYEAVMADRAVKADRAEQRNS
jgi:hypothetical protein